MERQIGAGIISTNQLAKTQWVAKEIKSQLEIQYLKASISEGQRVEFGRLLATTIGQIESAHFPFHSGIRFPQNGCVSCSHVGLSLQNQKLIDANLIRTSGVDDLAWLDELVD